MKIKNILLMLLALLGISLATQAQSARSISFLNGSYLIVPYGPASSVSTNYYSGSVTNMLYVNKWIQTNSTTYPYVSSYSPSYTIGSGMADVPLWANRDGTAPLANLAVAFSDFSTIANTNTLTFTLTTFASGVASAAPGAPAFINTQAQNQWSFTSPVSNGTNWIAISTNIPTGFLQGAHRVRLTVTAGPIGTNNSGGTTIITGSYSSPVTNTVNGWQLAGAWINGFTPDNGN